MGLFYCHGCDRHHDSKDGEYNVTADGKEYCHGAYQTRLLREQYAAYLKALPHGALRLEFEDFCDQIDAMQHAAESRMPA